MVSIKKVCYAKVFHKRHFPTEHFLSYKLYYFYLSYKKNKSRLFSYNKFNFYSVYDRDYLNSENDNLYDKVKKILNENDYQLSDKNQLYLLTHPRVLGYQFNPVSFWFIIENQQLKAVLAEVHNTFGEIHCYFLKNENNESISNKDVFTFPKEFHVSPFFRVEGFYKFRFDVSKTKVNIQIDYYKDDTKLLSTGLKGKLISISNIGLIKLFFKQPMVSLKVILLIHYNAFRLFLKRIPIIKKPDPPKELITKVKKNNAK